MAEEPKLVPVFIPPLVTLLAHAELQKGSPLTEEEVLQIRDNGICMMMAVERADKLTERNGPDVDPQNCWVEWQQRRAANPATG